MVKRSAAMLLLLRKDMPALRMGMPHVGQQLDRPSRDYFPSAKRFCASAMSSAVGARPDSIMATKQSKR